MTAIFRYIEPFGWITSVTDRQTDRQTDGHNYDNNSVLKIADYCIWKHVNVLYAMYKKPRLSYCTSYRMYF